MIIREALPAEIDIYIQTMKAAGLGARTGILRLCFEHPDIHPYVACQGGDIVGTGCATAYSRGDGCAATGPASTGWLGYISVLPGCRRRGVGRAMAAYGEEWLRSRGTESIVLLATSEGQDLYTRMGYVSGMEYIAFEGMGLEATPDQPPGSGPADGVTISALEAEDWRPIAELDRLATGESRLRLLKSMSEISVARDDRGQIVGFHACGPWGTGPIVSRDDYAGRLLLDLSRQRFGARPMRVHVPSANSSAVEYLGSRGFRESHRSLYMVKGPWPSPYNPRMIFSMFGFSFG